MYFQYIVLGIYYFIGILYFLVKDFRHAKLEINENKTYISLNNENRILDKLIDNNINMFE